MNHRSSCGATIGDEVESGDVRGEIAMQLRIGGALVAHVFDGNAFVFEQRVIEIVPRTMAGDVDRAFQMRNDFADTLAA